MTITDVLRTNYAHQPWTITEDDYSTLDWQGDEPKPTKSELEEQIPHVAAAAAQVIADRAAAVASARAKLAKLGLTDDEIDAFLA